MATARLSLNGANVDREFRDELFDAANRAGMTPNEFAIVAAAEKLARMGRSFSGVFHRGDVKEMPGFPAATARQPEAA